MLTNEIAIVGIDSQFGRFTNIDKVARALYLGKSSHDNCFSSDSQASTVVSQSITSLLTAIDADNVGVGTEATTKESPLQVILVSDGLFVLENNHILEHCQFTQVSELSQAMKLAISLLKEHKLVALIGVSVNQSPDEQALLHASEQVLDQQSQQNTISFDECFSGYEISEGIASLLLTSQGNAITQDFPIYATINACEFSAVNVQAMAQAIKQSLEQTALNDDGINTVGLVEVSALSEHKLSDLEASVLASCYQGQPLTCAISSVKSVVGDSGAFVQVLGLLHSVIALHQRYIPGINGWQLPSDNQLNCWQSSNFYIPTEPRPRFPNSDGSVHRAAFSCLSTSEYCHIVISENKKSENNNTEHRYINQGITSNSCNRINGYFAQSDNKLVVIAGHNEDKLQQQINELLAKLTEGRYSLTDIAQQQYQHFLTQSDLTKENTQFTLVLLAESLIHLEKELNLAKSGIEQVFCTKNSSAMHWQTPNGSYFSANPVGLSADDTNNVCFMYPGIGATYLGLGRELFQLFPEIYDDVCMLTDDIGSSLKEALLFPRSLTRLDYKALQARELALRGKLADIAEAGVAFSCVFTKIFNRIFKLNPSFSMGYSMGEVSMFAALDCWQNPSEMSTRLAQSKTFNERLSGELLALANSWQLPSVPDVLSKQALWETYNIKATLADVEAACVDEPRVYCTIINTPDSLLIGGYPDDCLRVIKKLGVRAMPLNMANAIHSEPAKAEYESMVNLYTMAVNERNNTKMYSSSCYLPIPQLSKAIANSIAKCLCERVDFPRLVNKVVDDGARVFIEMGPGRSLSSWVDKTLSQQKIDTVSVSVNAKGVTDETSYLKAVAKLVSHGVKLDLNRLFYGSIVMCK